MPAFPLSIGAMAERVIAFAGERVVRVIEAPEGMPGWRSTWNTPPDSVPPTVLTIPPAPVAGTRCAACEADERAAAALGHARGCAEDGPDATLALCEAACLDTADALDAVGEGSSWVAGDARTQAAAWRQIATRVPPAPTATLGETQALHQAIDRQWRETRTLVQRYFHPPVPPTPHEQLVGWYRESQAQGLPPEVALPKLKEVLGG